MGPYEPGVRNASLSTVAFSSVNRGAPNNLQKLRSRLVRTLILFQTTRLHYIIGLVCRGRLNHYCGH